MPKNRYSSRQSEPWVHGADILVGEADVNRRTNHLTDKYGAVLRRRPQGGGRGQGWGQSGISRLSGQGRLLGGGAFGAEKEEEKQDKLCLLARSYKCVFDSS